MGRFPVIDPVEYPLILRAQSGDDDAMNMIIVRHIDWANRKAESFFRRNPDLDFHDLLSLALEAVWTAAERFRPHHGHTLRWVASRNFRWLATENLKTFLRHKSSMPMRSRYYDMDRLCDNEISSLFLGSDRCIDCGTYDGLIPKGKVSPKRVRGRCSACHNRFVQHNDTAYRRERREAMRQRFRERAG
jgi:hypothetical protein